MGIRQDFQRMPVAEFKRSVNNWVQFIRELYDNEYTFANEEEVYEFVRNDPDLCEHLREGLNKVFDLYTERDTQHRTKWLEKINPEYKPSAFEYTPLELYSADITGLLNTILTAAYTKEPLKVQIPVNGSVAGDLYRYFYKEYSLGHK